MLKGIMEYGSQAEQDMVFKMLNMTKIKGYSKKVYTFVKSVTYRLIDNNVYTIIEKRLKL